MSNASLEKGGGDVTGPGAGASTDERLARWDGTTGTLLQDSNVQVTDDGEMTNTLQPCFLSRNTVTDVGVTGAGTVAVVEFNGTAFDQGGDYDNINTFTAPVTGKYFLTTCVSVTNVTAAMTGGQWRMITSNRSYFPTIGNIGDNVNTSGAIGIPITVVTDMDAADTASVNILIQNGAGDTADIVGGAAATTQTWFQGCLLA